MPKKKPLMGQGVNIRVHQRWFKDEAHKSLKDARSMAMQFEKVRKKRKQPKRVYSGGI